MSVSPYECCVFGPVDSPSMGSGVPDGSNLKTVVFEHRQTVTIQPDKNGNLTFAVVASPTGAVAISGGKATVTINEVATGASWDYKGPITATYDQLVGATPTAPWAGSTSSFDYALVPFTDKLVSGTVSVFDQGLNTQLRADKFRVVTCTARVTYTGATLYDGGVAATTKMTMFPDQYLPIPAGNGLDPNGLNHIEWGPILEYSPVPVDWPTSFSAVAATAGARTFPVRESAEILLVPTDHTWQQLRNSWAPIRVHETGLAVYSACTVFPQFLISGGNLYPGPIEGIGHSDVAFYAATGMGTGDTVGSVTVEVRTCVEYAVSYNSPMSRMATLAAPVDRPALARVEAAARTLPSSRPATAQNVEHGWMDHFMAAMKWYGRTMGNIGGTIWSAAGQVLQRTPLAPVGLLTDSLGRMMLSGTRGDPGNRAMIGM
jgi:hypothetical protein